MVVYRISTCNYIGDLSGEGAYLAGGRWNSKGVRLLYASSSLSLCMLEVLVHSDGLPIRTEMCSIHMELDKKSVAQLDLKDLDKDWSMSSKISYTKRLGDTFVKDNQYLAMMVPSVIVPSEYNVLINPFHSLFTTIKIEKPEGINFDGRLT